ncbi:GTP-binding protein TrmE N-terminus-domain-containing protein [Tirmania nivea]|nr:GTP-binding protein TrmE N-terminus-domain-containing protein [Tirmania nivea]
MRAFVRTCTRNHPRTISTPSTAYTRASHIPYSIVSLQQTPCPWPSSASHHRGFGTSCGVNSSRMLATDTVSTARTPDSAGADSAGADSADATIFALSTPPGKSAIAVVRASGPACLEIYRALCPNKPLPKPRHATLRVLYEPASSQLEVLDPGALILYFPSPRSTTGEDILELHLHGGPAILRSVLAAIPKCQTPISNSPIRYAEPGEFTRRAFLNDRLSLPQIEALGDALSAETEQQRKLSLRGSGAGLTSLYESWRRQLIEARGELEALIDFSEDQSFEVPPRELLAGVTHGVKRLKRRMRAFVENAVRGELLRDGISISLVGAPNVGKSSLLNRIVGREAVIVSREAGTTRDIVDLSVDIGGYVMVVGDTAGLRIGDIGGGSGNLVGGIEREGIRRARKRVMEGDVVVVVLAVEEDELSGELSLPIAEEVVEMVREAVGGQRRKEVVVCVNKMDLLQEYPPPSDGQLPPIPGYWRGMIMGTFPALSKDAIAGISCHDSKTSISDSDDTDSDYTDSDDIDSDDTTLLSPGSLAPTAGTNIQPLLSTLISLFARMTTSSTASSEAEDSLSATTRQRLLIESCLRYLDRYLEMVEVGSNVSAADDEGGCVDVVLAAEELRSAAGCLSRITGKGEGGGDVEKVLGVVFEKFCVGK